MEKKDERNIYISDFILINLPVIALGFAVFLSLFFITIFEKVPKLVFILIAWWSLCCMVMLLKDYFKIKRDKFIRLISVQKIKKVTYPKGLKSTICGLCIILALKNRLRTM